MIDGESVYEAWSNAVDWPKVESDVNEARADIAAELREIDPGYIPAPERCPHTLDMFKRV